MTEPHCHVRSISMPTRSHPITVEIEKILRTLRTSELSTRLKSETINVHLAGLIEAYNCIEDLLQLPLTQQGMSSRCHEKWIEDELNESVRLLDVCSTAKDVLLQMKDQAQDLQTVLRSRGSEADKQQKVRAYLCFRKKMNKNINKCLGELKRMDTTSVPTSLVSQDQHQEMVIKVVKEVREITISFFHTLLSFISSPALKPKSRKWSLVSKFIHNGKKGLEALETSIKDLETGLQCLFKRLIEFRVTLLNICTQ
ncbi:hypothetical protein AQUCO_01500477v1 [Aquilegia coerulea]|uniref:Uncharacterized protein n=1 Tax=Aquilegia coerulea TaxID=218851 RepID=A0A2G5DTV9_AQUCA|nr:hypothetical protein AQUCO_01500477v1 [Aquilegia coerulea]